MVGKVGVRLALTVLLPYLLTLPAQLLAYHLSVARGIDPDFPRNLSKTLNVD